ncbi:hypothetical protein P9281_34600 [Caballeronia sp. LP003]|uniref:hypothetical protein n=1 Tax=Caballeronia sp. LP003 TaxID=3038551 RepID=UPI002857849E|nr:hypothetical protein [Caballeronia sp. LP003]MDR5791679.1 hypothetical protein [Caballeronia sp. LP003]
MKSASFESPESREEQLARIARESAEDAARIARENAEDAARLRREACFFRFGILLAIVVIGLAVFTWVTGGMEERKTAASLLTPIITAVMGFMVGKGKSK